MRRVRRAFSPLSEPLAKAARDRRLTRREQLSVVRVGHFGVLGAALLVVWRFETGSGVPIVFIVGEAAIIIICGLLTTENPSLRRFWARALGWDSKDGEAEAADDGGEESTPEEKIAGVVLFLAFIVQFAALGSLLWETGGPLKSPFAGMTLAIAIFTPFIANEAKTVLSVVALSILYYAGLIYFYADSHPAPSSPQQLQAAIEAAPPDWAYFVVNVLVLLGAIIFTIYESLVRGWEATRLAEERADSETAAAAAAGADDGATGVSVAAEAGDGNRARAPENQVKRESGSEDGRDQEAPPQA